MLSDHEWSEATAEVLRELAEALMLGDHLPTDADVSAERAGMIALVGEEASYQLVLVASGRSCDVLARRMLMIPDDEEIDPGDVADAVCEIVNIYAGMLKSVVSDRARGLHLGLPVFVRGELQPPAGTATTRVAASLGGEGVQVLLARMDAAQASDLLPQASSPVLQ